MTTRRAVDTQYGRARRIRQPGAPCARTLAGAAEETAVDRIEPTVVVSVCTSRVEAELKRGALEDAGLRAVVASDDAGGLHPEMAVAYCGAHRLLVPESEADPARDLLAELDRGDHALHAEPADDARGAHVSRDRSWFMPTPSAAGP